MRFGMLTQWYDPERGSAALPGIISRAIGDLGHEVHVLTAYPNYPSGELQDGYRLRLYQRETIRGIEVHRAPLYVSHDTNVRRRMLNYATFALGSSGVALSKFPKVDAVLVHSTPATVALTALTLKAMRRTPYVVHIQDLWPQTVTSSSLGQGSLLKKVEPALNAMCDLIYRQASTVAVTSPGMKDLIVQRGVNPEKVHLATNWADEDAFRPVSKNHDLGKSLGIVAPFVVMYAGNLGEFQDLQIVVESASILKNRADIQFVLVGGGVVEAELRFRVRELGLENVTFVPSQPFAKMADIMALSDVQLVSLRDIPLFRSTIPSKLQATLAAGRPVIGAVTGDAAGVIREAGAGEVVTPGSATQLAGAVQLMAEAGRERTDAMGAAGRRYYLQHFSRRVASAKLVGLLELAADGHTSRAS